MRAYCWRSGVLELGPRLPKGALPVLRATDGRKLRKAVEGNCRWAYDNRTMLVPGLPEAQSDVAALEALHAFTMRLRKAIAR